MALTAFVLAGGGSLGAVQVGMLKALCQRRIVPDLLVGASVGAINAAYFAARPDAAGAAALEQVWLGLRRAEVFPLSLRHSLSCLLGSGQYLVDSAPLQALIAAQLPYSRLEQATVPCHVIATDVLDGSEVDFSDGPAVPALLASAAIPVVFPPVQLGGRYLADGGVGGLTPISVACALGATRVLVLPTGRSCALQVPPRGAIAIALHTLNQMAMRQLQADIERFAGRCDLQVVPPLCPLAVHAYDFSHTSELIGRAEVSTAAWLRDGPEDPDPRWPLAPHRHPHH
ncbi:patatin-like phospholipase family protein [Stenotrophomonas sp. YIM B06876]|uniref:patatin-like phospholipase family protein n=1 Tax=Stenotrophomonas sp. YIM B06876 TaxID=3060211 RepID=UPI0027388FE8|nr:patatin-like phospholipase family protein [Stenotrophomonas sp. YIM B06876]